MKIIALLLSAFFCISVSNTQKKPVDNQKSHMIEKPINSQWTFNYFPKETEGKGFELPGFDDSKWPAISLPHTWSSYETTGEFHPFIWKAAEIDNIYLCTGWCWYRKHFTINRNYSDRKAFIKFEHNRPFTKGEILRLAPATDPEKMLIGVELDSKNNLTIWGLADIGSSWWKFIHGQSSGGAPPPDALIISSTNPGNITI